MKLTHRKAKNAFTLVETVIAMGIITIMLTGFLAAFAPAVKGIKNSIGAKEANRLATTLEQELASLRPNETSQYDNAFEKAYEWIQDSHNSGDSILIYQYKGDTNGSANSDGSLPAYTGNDGIPGRDYIIQSVARKQTDTLVSSELQPGVVQGRVFVARLTQMIYDQSNGGLIVSSNPTQIVDPYTGSAASDAASYPEAVIALQMEVFILPNSLYAYVRNFEIADVITNNRTGNTYPRATGPTIFTRNMAVRR
ncbi:type IV pilus modification PilV family protein [Persicirhabdus sediminis]|uniref:Type II secretion system protein n=1 Tax=Persicirhabdus sediminis TaxID=454144 RepID=A0A8J7MGE8_9BACT|nr:type II secretion system protein [Persicirhabdus sediminis]MBK1792382.1 type II secretion system protein [Persicirhabdus sediminis]